MQIYEFSFKNEKIFELYCYGIALWCQFAKTAIRIKRTNRNYTAVKRTLNKERRDT